MTLLIHKVSTQNDAYAKLDQNKKRGNENIP